MPSGVPGSSTPHSTAIRPYVPYTRQPLPPSFRPLTLTQVKSAGQIAHARIRSRGDFHIEVKRGMWSWRRIFAAVDQEKSARESNPQYPRLYSTTPIREVIAWHKGKHLQQRVKRATAEYTIAQQRNRTKWDHYIVGYAEADRICKVVLGIEPKKKLGQLGPMQRRKVMKWAKEW